MFDLGEKLSNSWEIMGQCAGTLRKDPELVVFPVISGLALAAVVGSFLVPLSGSDYAPLLLEKHEFETLSKDPVAWVILFGFYFACYFTITFFNAALVACAVVRFRGKNPNVWTGLQFAGGRLPQIVAWSLVAASVGLLLRVIESDKRWGVKLVAAFLGVAWSIATYFVVPALVMEQIGPIDAIKKSATAMRKTWGETLITGISLGPMKLLAMLVAAIPLAISLAWQQLAVFWVGLAISAVLWIAVTLYFATLQSILVAALYLFGTQGKVAKGFDADFLEHAFLPREAEG